MAADEPLISDDCTSNEESVRTATDVDMCIGAVHNNAGAEAASVSSPSEKEEKEEREQQENEEHEESEENDESMSDEVQEAELAEQPEEVSERRGVKRKFDEVEDLNPNLMQKLLEITHVKYNDMRQVIRERKKNQPTFSREFFLTKMMRNLTAMYSPVQCNPMCNPNQMASDENYWLTTEEDARPVTPDAAAAAVAASNTSLQAPAAQYSHSPMQYNAYNYNAQPQYPYQYDMGASSPSPYHQDSGNAYGNMYHAPANTPYNSSQGSEYHNGTGNGYENISLGSPFETPSENMAVSSPSSACPSLSVSSGYTATSSGYDNTTVSSPYEITTVRSDYDATAPVSTYHNLTAPSSYQNSVASTYANMKGGGAGGYNVSAATAMDDAMDITTSSQGTQHVSTGVTRNELESLAATLAPMWEETDNSTMLPSIETYISNDQYEYVWKILATAQS